jgi:SSS family solute:Na+ symporter
MTDQLIIIGAILSFIAVGFYSKKSSKTIGEFSVHRNKFGWFPIAAGISMTYAGGAALLNMASLGMVFKWQGMVDPLGLIGGILIVILLIKRYRNDEGVTISDLLAGSNQKLSVLIGLITTFVFVLITASQVVALSKVLVPYFPNIDYTVLTIVPTVLVCSYLFLGGFFSVTKTDILQLFFIIFFLFVPVLYFLVTKSSVGIVEKANPEYATMPLNLIILLSISLVYLPISQDVNIRVKSAKNTKHAIIGLLVGALIYTLIIASSTYIGIFLAESGAKLADTEEAFPIFFKEYFPGWGVLVVLAALAAIVSSLDAFLLNAITSLSNDIIAKTKLGKSKSHNTLLKIASIIVFVLAIAIAIWFNQILTLVLTALLIYISTVLPIALARKLSVKDDFIFVSSVLLILTIILLEVFKVDIELKAVVYPLIGIAFTGASYILQKLITKRI